MFIGNKIYFIAQEEEERDSLYFYVPEENRIEKIENVSMTAAFGSMAASPDKRFIYYNRLEIQQKDNYRYELRRFDTERQEDTLITDSGRYRSIDISPDGQTLVTVSMRAGKSYLLEIPIAKAGDPSHEKILACGALQENFSSPRYSSDGRYIVFIQGGKDGFDLLVFDHTKGFSQKVYHSQDQLVFSTWSYDNKSVIFSSDESGIYNLYQVSVNPTGYPTPLTHVIGGIFASDFSPDGKTITAVAYDSNGYYLTLFPYEPTLLAGKKLPCIKTKWEGKKRDRRFVAENIIRSEKDPAIKSYYSMKHIQFDYWGPWMTLSSNGVQGGFGAVFSDPTGYQNFCLLGGMESEYETKLGEVHYIYKGLYPALYLFASQDQEIYPNLLKSEDRNRYEYAEEVRAVGIAVEIPFIKREHEISLQVGYQFLDRVFIEDSKDDYLGKTIINKNLSEKSEGAVWTKLFYFNGTSFKKSNSVEDGRLITLAIEKTDPSLGGDLSRTRILGEWNEYISNPWLKNHVLKLSCHYGFGRGDRTDQDLFGLGGFSNPLVSRELGIQRSLSIRGYEENFQVGHRIIKVCSSYRFPILDISEAAINSVPIYYKQLFAEVYYEGGRTWNDKGDNDNLRWINAMGLEVNFSFKLLRFIRIAPGFGLVFAPDQIKNISENDKSYQFYMSIKGFVNF